MHMKMGLNSHLTKIYEKPFPKITQIKAMSNELHISAEGQLQAIGQSETKGGGNRRSYKTSISVLWAVVRLLPTYVDYTLCLYSRM